MKKSVNKETYLLHNNKEYTFKNIMACMRNERDDKGKLIYGVSTANHHREPFMKYVLNFTGKCNGSADSQLLQLIKREMNNALVCIKERYKHELGKKKYFLIDVEGGGSKHYDYSLFAFTELEKQKSQNKMLRKEYLFKKLEFKSSGTDKKAGAKTINKLPEYLSKAPNEFFKTPNNTFLHP